MKPQQQKLIIQAARENIKLQVKAEIEKEAEKWRAQTAQQMYAVVLKNLFDKYNFTPNMLWQFFERCTKDFDAIADKYAKIDDFYELLGEMGIKIK